MRNPNEDFLTTLTNEKTNNKNIIIAQKNNSQKKEYRYNKMLNTHKITSLNLELSDIHKNLPEHISNELSQKKGVTKKASIDFGFNPNENLKLYLTSTIGEVNYSNTAQGDATRLQLTPNVNNLKVGVKFNF
ncbi:MAG TPA: hypothetical protein VI861_01555 [Rickettsiales bacterium]|nr:hypothetical protein [Rickettsiales bacterium]